MSFDFPKVSIAGLPIAGKVTLTNTGSKRFLPQVISISSNILASGEQMLNANSIPPFGSQTWDLSFHPLPFLTKTDAAFTIHFAPGSDLSDKMPVKSLKIAPFFLTAWGI